MRRWHSGSRFVAGALLAVGLAACADEGGCPVGTWKDGKWCRRIDAGAGDGGTEAGLDPVLGGDGAVAVGDGAVSPLVDSAVRTDAATSDASVAWDGASSSADGSTASTDAANVADTGSSPTADTGVTTDTGAVSDTGTQDAAPDAVVSCGAGYLLKNGKCEDIDECFEGTHQCHMTATCKDTDGSYDCTCPLGYSGGTNAGFACAPRIAVGSEHACVLLLDGTVQCWGKNASGQLGDGTQMERTIPVTVAGLRDAAALAAGTDYNCAILKDRTVRCWGNNEGGKLGDGTLMNRSTPVTVPRLDDIIAIDAALHTCAVQQSGSVKCWGENGKGQLGSGVASAPVPSPGGVSGLNLASNVFVGFEQSCVTNRNLSVPCWGAGYLTASGMTMSLTPIELPLGGDIRGLAFGYRHACGVLATGAVYCWGTAGLIGTGVTSGDLGPTLIQGLTAKSVAIGFYTSYALRRDGTVAWWFGTAPQTASGIVGAVALDAYFSNACVILDDGSVACWTVMNPNGGATLTAPRKVAGLDLW